MKNFMNYICLFLMILGINVSANAATFTVTPNPIVIDADLDDGVATGEINVTYDIVGGMEVSGNYGWAIPPTVEGDNKDDIILDITGLESYALSPTGKGSFKITYETLDEGTYVATLTLWCYTSEYYDYDEFNVPVTINVTNPQPQVDLTNYQTYCPRTVSFDLNGLPGEAPADIVTKKNLTITAPKDPVTPEGLTFIGWYNWENDQRWNFETDVVTDDMILYAKCRSALTISGDVHLTSANGIEVFTTNFAEEPNKNIVVSMSSRGDATKLRVRFLDSDDNEVAPADCPFALYYYGWTGSGTHNDYTQTYSGTNNYHYIDISGCADENFSQTFAVGYRPKSAGVYDTYKIKIEACNSGNAPLGNPAVLTLEGRSLPEKFIIAQKVGDDWYALPNDMSNNQTNPAAVKISVVNEETGTATIYSDVVDHLAYQLQSKGTGTGVAFSSPIKDNYVIKVNTTEGSSTIGLYAQSGWNSSTGQFYEFTPVTSDLVDYTLQNVFQTNYLGITEGNWGIGASHNVRFLAIDQQPAATITWQNEMLGTQHAQNAAEDGVITLPTIADPIACERAIAAGWVFFGWGDQIATTKTAEPTILVGGEVAKADKTYYAIFRRGTENVWRTSCPTVYTITYKANGGEGTDHVVYTELTTATAITVETAGFTKEGSQFIGWTVAGSEDALIQPGGTISGINSDIIVNAQWMGELVISGDVQLTSAVGQKVATATTGITFSSTDMSYATALRITYRDETNEIDYNRTGDHSYTSSEFRLCNGSYNFADGSNISLAEVTGAYEQTYSISYTPNDGVNTLDHYTMKVEVLRSATVIATVTKDLYGRTLPEKFAIVAHVGDMWYALPNNMAGSGTYAPVAVSVDNSDASIVNWTATGAKTAGYSMKAMTADYNKLRFAAIAAEESNQKCLWAATSGNTGIQNWAYNSTEDNYRWTVTPQDANFQAYTLVNEKNTQNLRYWSAQNAWGMYASGETNLYFIPLTDMEVADFQVIEWFANKVLIETNNQTINTSSAKTSVGSGEYAAAIVDGTTYGTNQYTLTTGDLTTSAGQPLNIQYQTTAGDAWYINRVKVPIIVSQGTKATSTDLLGGLSAQSKYPENDLVVRDGATLTVDAATGTWNTFKNVTIYPTSKVVVPAKASDDATKDVTMTTTTMTLFGGIDEIYNGSEYTLTKYIVPQLVLNGTLVHNETTSGLVYDVRVDEKQYYNFALPYTSMYELVTDHKGAYDYKYWVKVYDGQTRAETGNGWVWYNWNADPWALNIGTGYMLEAQSKVGQNYVILRHPLGYSETGNKYAQNLGGHHSGTPEETKAAVNVYAHPSTYANNAGWNYIANPFMANFSKDLGDGSTGTIQTGKLVEHKVNEKWDGHYVWEAGSMSVRYVTLYDNGSDTYEQLPMSEAVLAPFTGFFVQMAENGTIVFDISGRANAAPARMLSADELPSEMEIFLHAACQGQKDDAVLFINDDLNRDNAKEFPNEMTKQENANTLNFYTFGGDDVKMYANGMSYEDAQGWSKAGVKVATAGEYTFSVASDKEEYIQQVILKDMDSNTEYDLMNNDAKIYLDKGEMNDRFFVKIVFGKHNIGTGITERYDVSAPEKFILNDHMYIRANGVLYDGVGKRVKY